jgi:hypothetical protein
MYNKSNDIGKRASAPFIIRIWVEEDAQESGMVVWRGSITHVASGKRIYFNSIDKMNAVIISYLREWGVDL